MKSFRRLIIVFIFLALLTVNCNAVSGDELQKDIDLSKLYDTVDDTYKEYLPDIEKTESIQDYDINSFAELLGVVFSKCFPDIKELLGNLLCTVFGLSIINAAKGNISSRFFSETIDFLSTVISISLGYGLISDTLYLALNFIDSTKVFITALAPVSALLFTLGGNVSTAVVSSSGLTFLITLTELFITEVILPTVKICFGMSIVGCVGKHSGILKFSSSIKKIFLTLLSGTVSVFGIFLVYKCNLSATADTFAARTVKFAGSFIPIIGSPLGESLKSIMSGLDLIKHSVGVLGILIISVITLPVILSILLRIFCINISIGVASLLGGEEYIKIFEEFASLLSFIFAVVCCTCVLMILGLTIPITISPALGGG